MRFFVTYCAMDQQLANPLWHACLVLSYWPGPEEKIEVTNSWGFYAAPMANPNSNINKIKKKFGFVFDFKGNYGHLMKEEVRFLDLGYGLCGVTFEISLEQFMDLKKRCADRMAIENQAIQEAKERLSKKGVVPTSIDIFHEEQRCALQENRESRLGEFGFNYSIKKGFQDSNTCKTGALQLLRDIGIDKEQIDNLVPSSRYVAFPRVGGGQLEQFHLHSTGPLQKHTSNRTGKINFFRVWDVEGTKVKRTKVYWTFPPQNIISEDAELSTYFTISPKYAAQSKRMIRQLQSIEHEIRNASLPAELDAQRLQMAQQICDLYYGFSTLNSVSTADVIEAKITAAERFLNSLYTMINDSDVDAGVVAMQLPVEVKKKICEIMGQHFLSATLTLSASP